MPVGKSFDEYRDAAIEREPALAEDLYDASVEVELGIALTRLRHLRGLTQRELADRCGIKQPMLVRIERGSQSPGVATLARILRALNGAVEVGPDGRVTAHAVSAEEGQKEEVHVDQGFADVRGNEPAAPAMGLGGMSAPGETQTLLDQALRSVPALSSDPGSPLLSEADNPPGHPQITGRPPFRRPLWHRSRSPRSPEEEYPEAEMLPTGALHLSIRPGSSPKDQEYFSTAFLDSETHQVYLQRLDRELAAAH